MYYMRSEQMIMNDAFNAALLKIHDIGNIRKEQETTTRRNIDKYNKRMAKRNRLKN